MDGKINQEDFNTLFAEKLGFKNPKVQVAPAFGVDVSIVNLSNSQDMALTSDPLSLIPSLGLEESAWLSVHLMANDMATTGKAPQFGQFVLNLPTHLTQEDLKTYWHYIHQFCKEIKLSITGGHTGRIEGQNSTIAGGGTFITVAENGSLLASSQAREKDVVIMTKSAALSSAAILGMSFPKHLSNIVGKEVSLKARELFYRTSSLKEGIIAASLNENEKVVSALHDVTEGGVLGALFELATAAQKGILIQESKILVDKCVASILNAFDLNPLECIGAGSMLIAVKESAANQLIEKLNNNNIEAAIIANLLPSHKGLKVEDKKGTVRPLQYLDKDPYWSAFFKALKKGWK